MVRPARLGLLSGQARSNGAPEVRCLCLDGPRQKPRKRGSRRLPHKNPKDETTLSGTRRHGC